VEPILAIGWLAAALLILLGLPLQLLLWLLCRPFDRNVVLPGKFLRLVGLLLGKCYPKWRFRLEGAWPEHPGPYVVMANHQSLLDIVLLCRVPHEMKWVIKEELFKVPWIGWMLRLTGDIAVRRGDPESGGEAIARARAYLAQGMNVMIFPEGTRSRDARLLPFKSGAFRLAIEAGVPVLPVAIWGTATGIQKGALAVAPCDALGRILPPFPTAGLTPSDAVALREKVRAAIAAALPPEATAPPPPRPRAPAPDASTREPDPGASGPGAAPGEQTEAP
jgi:1-acyl-sn-glycerol-3-phosphate acyltransferase